MVARRLAGKRREIVEAIFSGIETGDGSDARGLEAPEVGSYLLSLQSATAEMLDCLFGRIEEAGEECVSIPNTAGTHARWAVRRGIPLETVLRAVIVGHTFLSEAICGETQDLSPKARQQVVEAETSMLRCLVAVVSREYRDEQARFVRSAGQRRRVLIERLLQGTSVDQAELAYPLDVWHIGVIAEGASAADTIRSIARSLSGIPLMIQRNEGTFWAWIGSRSRLGERQVAEALSTMALAHVRVALGEPAYGPAGCRHTHAEARAAFSVAARKPPGVTFFSAVALEAMALQAPEVTRSLQDFYLKPLRGKPRGGMLRDTLQAYFRAQRNVSSTAAALGVTRRTVENRLRTIETGLGRPLHRCEAELELALRVGDLLDIPQHASL